MGILGHWVFGSGLQGSVEDGNIRIQMTLKPLTGQEPRERAQTEQGGEEGPTPCRTRGSGKREETSE